jgi:uncharacterized protein
MPLTAALWAIVFLAALVLLSTRRRAIGAALLAIAYALALLAGLITSSATISLVVLLAAGYAVQVERARAWRVAGHVAFVAIAILLGLHLLPGFNNLSVIGPVRFTPDAMPFTMYLNLDKPLAGFWVLLVWPALCLERGAWSWARGLFVGFATAIVCLGLALAFGQVAVAPKWPPLGWLWAINNLLLVCLTEEAVFRGYLQEGMTRRLGERRHADAIAVMVAAVLFGLAHFAGGIAYVLLATLAGVGYGIAYRLSGLQAAVLAHFTLNLLHFGLFTYPMLAW